MTTTKIPAAYRIFFLYIDPLIGLSGLYIFFFDHAFYLKSGIPASLAAQAQYTPVVRFLIFALGSYSLAIAAMQVYLLQAYKNAPNGLNVRIWKFVQAAILLIDLGLLGAMVDVDVKTSMMPGRWGQGEWSNFGVLGLVIAFRSAFLLGIGL